MKSNLFKYIPIILLTIFSCAVSIQNISALSKNFNKSISKKTFTVKKRFEALQVPANEHSLSGENLFENETEDKSETAFKATLTILHLSADFTALLFFTKAIAKLYFNHDVKDIGPPLYLSICSFRI